MTYEALLFAHVVGACVLLGTGSGIAFFMVIAQRSRSPALIAHTAGIVVLADMVFTATAAALQPVTGVLLMVERGWPWTTGWIWAGVALYVAVGALWLPVVWIQVRLKRIAEAARDAGTPLPDAYHRLYRLWFLMGCLAFPLVLVIVWLMLTKPAWGG